MQFLYDIRTQYCEKLLPIFLGMEAPATGIKDELYAQIQRAWNGLTEAKRLGKLSLDSDKLLDFAQKIHHWHHFFDQKNPKNKDEEAFHNWLKTIIETTLANIELETPFQAGDMLLHSPLIKNQTQTLMFLAEESCPAWIIYNQAKSDGGGVGDITFGVRLEPFATIERLLGAGSVIESSLLYASNRIVVKTPQDPEHIKGQRIEYLSLQDMDFHPFLLKKGAMLAMDEVSGENLESFYNKNTLQLSGNQKIEIFWKVLEAVIAIHKKGILHNDIKPLNIMIFRQYPDTSQEKIIVRFVDFGGAASLNTAPDDPHSPPPSAPLHEVHEDDPAFPPTSPEEPTMVAVPDNYRDFLSGTDRIPTAETTDGKINELPIKLGSKEPLRLELCASLFYASPKFMQDLGSDNQLIRKDCTQDIYAAGLLFAYQEVQEMLAEKDQQKDYFHIFLKANPLIPEKITEEGEVISSLCFSAIVQESQTIDLLFIFRSSFAIILNSCKKDVNNKILNARGPVDEITFNCLSLQLTKLEQKNHSAPSEKQHRIALILSMIPAPEHPQCTTAKLETMLKASKRMLAAFEEKRQQTFSTTAATSSAANSVRGRNPLAGLQNLFSRKPDPAKRPVSQFTTPT